MRVFDTKTDSELTEGIEVTEDGRITHNGFNVGRVVDGEPVMQPGYRHEKEVADAVMNSILEESVNATENQQLSESLPVERQGRGKRR